MDIGNTLTKLDTIELIAMILMIEKELSKRLEDEEDFTEYFEEYVTQSGMNNFEMSRRTEISRQALKSYIEGNRIPSITVLKKIVEVINTPSDQNFPLYSEDANLPQGVET